MEEQEFEMGMKNVELVFRKGFDDFDFKSRRQ